MKDLYKFDEVLNDLVDYFILGDPYCLLRYKTENNLPDDLLTEFTIQETGDQVVEQGVIVPLAGVANFPYTIYFNLSGNTPELLKEGSQLQVRQDGYALKVEQRQVYLFTMPYLRQFDLAKIDLLKKHRTATIAVENGWYSVSVLGGLTMQQVEINKKDGQRIIDTYLQPTFEFVLTPSIERPIFSADIAYSFAIKE